VIAKRVVVSALAGAALETSALATAIPLTKSEYLLFEVEMVMSIRVVFGV
jgi:hypothetical protein